jgi:hypothetical protein
MCGVRNLLPALVVLFTGCSSSSGGRVPHHASCGISPILGDGLRNLSKIRLSAGGTCLPDPEDCRFRFLVTVTIENVGNTELLVEPNRFEAFDATGDRVRRAYTRGPAKDAG